MHLGARQLCRASPNLVRFVAKNRLDWQVREDPRTKASMLVTQIPGLVLYNLGGESRPCMRSSTHRVNWEKRNLGRGHSDKKWCRMYGMEQHCTCSP